MTTDKLAKYYIVVSKEPDGRYRIIRNLFGQTGVLLEKETWEIMKKNDPKNVHCENE